MSWRLYEIIKYTSCCIGSILSEKTNVVIKKKDDEKSIIRVFGAQPSEQNNKY